MKDIKKYKEDLRRQIRSEAKRLDGIYLTESDMSITSTMLALPEWKKAETVFIYISVGTEPQTRGMIEEAFGSGKRVAVPRCLGNGIMEARAITSFDKLTPKSFGILEPDDSFPAVGAEEFDLVVAPCVTADKKCNRLGNGAGYYDRYLTKISCPIICLCRGSLMVDELLTEDFDLPVDFVLSELGMLSGQSRD